MGILNRLDRERRTMAAMLEMYCRRHHGSADGLCPECHDLATYAGYRIDRCPFEEGKPTCAKCPIHCYRPDRREEVRRIMRFAGPRMVLRHPILALFHCVDSRRAPEAVERTESTR